MVRSLLVLISLVLASIAQAEPRAALEEVIVSATKRSESLQDVSISVAVLSGDELSRRNKTQIEELSRLVAGFTFSPGTSDAARNIIVRGVGTQSLSRSVEQSVGTVVDNVASGSLSGSLLDYSDVERIEVLRGPQGMLFGKNASAGLLSITTRAPSDVLSGGIGLRYGSENLLNLSAYASGPLLDERLLGRLSVFQNSRDAILKNQFPGGDDLNNRNDWGARLKLQWLATDRLDMLFSVVRNERDHKCCQGALRLVEPGSVADREGGPVGERVDTIIDNDTAEGTTEHTSASIEVNYQFNDYTLTSVSAWLEDDVFGAFRSDLYTRTALVRNDSLANYQQVTQELRLSSPVGGVFDYVAGLYCYRQEIDRRFDRLIDLYGIDLVAVANTLAVSVLNTHQNTSESLAAFGQLNWHLSERLRLSLGLRYNNDELSIDQTVAAMPGTLPEAPPGSISASTSETAWSWRAIAEVDVADDAMMYLSIARGYKGPGANSLPSGPSSGNVFVAPEIPSNYELGLKSQWLGGRLRANVAVYFTRFEDFQASAQVPDAFPPIFFLANAGELETRGAELELTTRLSDRLMLSTSLAYTDAVFSEWPDGPCYSGQTAADGCIDGSQSLSGADMPNSPDWAINLTADYRIPLASMPFDAFISTSAYWRDETLYSTANDPVLVGESYAVFDVALGIEAPDQRYSAQLFVQNLFDEFYISSIEEQSVVGIRAAHGLPYDYTRRFGVSIQMNF